jgi:leader peptidase (prepilin peptidase)/N-methyltransferase
MTPAVLTPDAFPYAALVLGLVLGSFYNVCVHRYLAEESIVRPRSKCPACGHQLAWWENIPLLSYLLLRGRCLQCKQAISLRYPAVELASGLWALGLALEFGPTMPFVVHMVVGGILIIASFIDFDSYILPDVLTLPGAAIAFVGAWLWLDISVQESLIGAAAGAGVFLALQQGYRLLKGAEGLGTGDIKLMLLLGALIGWKGLPVAVTWGAILALVASLAYMRKGEDGLRTMVPFGPFLSLGAMLYVLFGQDFWRWYLG